MMWDAIAKLASLGLAVVERLWPKPKDNPMASPADIATAQSSGHTASREGKLASKRAAGYQPLPGTDAVRPPKKP